MKTRLWMATVVALACVLLAGCDFEVPLTKTATRKINPQLLGNWREQTENSDLLTIRRLDDETYIATIDGDVYRVYHSDVAARAFVTVQNLNDDERKYCYYAWELSPGGAELQLRRVNTKVIPEAVASSEAAQRLVTENIGHPKLLLEQAIFVREKR